MKTLAIVVLILIAAFYGVRHYSSAPHKPASSHEPVSSPETSSQPEEVVANTPPPEEVAALPSAPAPASEPRATVPKSDEPEPPSANHQELSGRIHEIQEQLRELNRAHDETMANAQSYQASVEQQNAAAASGIERQIQDTNSNIVNLQNQLSTADARQPAQAQQLEAQIANQKTLLGQLRSQRRQLNDSSQAAAAAGNRELILETDQMRQQRADLERQLHDLEAQRVSHR